MANLELSDSWEEILRLKEALPLRELARRFQTTPGAISAALRRVAGVAGPDVGEGDLGDDDLPPEPGEAPFRSPSSGGPVLPEVAAALQQIRAGSKDVMIALHATALGQVPDAEVARRAGVSIRTIASFRARHGIPGYRGPRRAVRVRAVKGAVSPTPVARPAAARPARAAAAAPATPPARVRRPEAQRAPRPDADGETRRAWQVIWRDATGEHRAVLLAGKLTEAAVAAERASVGGEIVGLALVGVVLDL
jgi:hypothetical protein